MSEELPTEQQIEELRADLAALDKARGDALEEYIDSLDQDEGDLAYGAEDEDRETLVTEISAVLENVETLLSDLSEIDGDMPEAERMALTKNMTIELNEELEEARSKLSELREDLKKDGIEPES